MSDLYEPSTIDDGSLWAVVDADENHIEPIAIFRREKEALAYVMVWGDQGCMDMEVIPVRATFTDGRGKKEPILKTVPDDSDLPDVLRTMTPEELAKFRPATGEQVDEALAKGRQQADLARRGPR